MSPWIKFNLLLSSTLASPAPHTSPPTLGTNHPPAHCTCSWFVWSLGLQRAVSSAGQSQPSGWGPAWPGQQQSEDQPQASSESSEREETWAGDKHRPWWQYSPGQSHSEHWTWPPPSSSGVQWPLGCEQWVCENNSSEESEDLIKLISDRTWCCSEQQHHSVTQSNEHSINLYFREGVDSSESCVVLEPEKVIQTT